MSTDYSQIKYQGALPSRPANVGLGTAMQEGDRCNISQHSKQKRGQEFGSLFASIGQFLKPAMRREKQYKEFQGVMEAKGASEEEMEEMGLDSSLGSWWQNVMPAWVGGRGNIFEQEKFHKEYKFLGNQTPMDTYASTLYPQNR